VRPAPAPVLGSFAEAGGDRVLQDVFAGRSEVVLAFDEACREPVAEDVPAAAVLRVVALRVAAVEQLHPGREVGAGAFDDHVVVGIHQAERMHAPAEAAHGEEQKPEQREAVVVVAEEPNLGHSESRRVVNPVGKQRTRLASHRHRR
jgi:hypothetical protein